jgi:hypothetical protein
MNGGEEEAEELLKVEVECFLPRAVIVRFYGLIFHDG